MENDETMIRIKKQLEQENYFAEYYEDIYNKETKVNNLDNVLDFIKL